MGNLLETLNIDAKPRCMCNSNLSIYYIRIGLVETNNLVFNAKFHVNFGVQ